MAEDGKNNPLGGSFFVTMSNRTDELLLVTCLNAKWPIQEMNCSLMQDLHLVEEAEIVNEVNSEKSTQADDV